MIILISFEPVTNQYIFAVVLHWGYRNILAGVHLFYTIYFCANLIISSDAVDEEVGIADWFFSL